MANSADDRFVDDEKLAHFAENVARRMQLAGTVSGAQAAQTLREQLRKLSQRHAATAARAQTETVGGAEEWLLDNWYLARREGQDAAAQLRAAGRLCAAEERAGQKTARILLLARELVRSGGGGVDLPRCEAFLRGFQEAQVLSGEELRLFCPAVRAALIAHILEQLRQGEDPLMPDGVRTQTARAFTSLRLLSTVDLSETLEHADRTEQLLRQDPAGVYPLMDERTRASYRARVACLAERAGIPEHLAAEKALTLAQSAAGAARHVGYYLFTEPLGAPARERRGGGYIAANVLLTVFLSLLMGFLTGSAACALLLLFPVSELIKNLLDNVLLRVRKPTQVPRLELAEGIPAEGKTLCAVSELLIGPEIGVHLAKRLEEFRLANRDAGENLLFAILADLPESKEKEIPGAADWIDAAAQEIEALNRRYGKGFFLLVRERRFCEQDGVWRGWERKRGALLHLMRFLRGKESDLRVAAGDAAALQNVVGVLTLDADTRLLPGAARELVGAMLHPLCRPEIDPLRRIVTKGYGILAPRMSVELAAANRSAFVRLFAGQGGTDPYGSAGGEVYMELCGHSGFAGKGLIDVDAFLRCMEGRIPENTVLSHDTLEGAFLRCGHVGDVELTDGFPSRPAAWFRRMERWTRGDWQNLPWLLKKGKFLTDIDRWFVFDKLRRSLAAPMCFVSILAGFLRPTGALGWAAAAALVAVLSNLLLLLADGMLRRGPHSRIRFHSAVVCGVWGCFAQTAVRLFLLPAEAVVSLSAILTALWRMLVSHRRLLQWQTAAQADARGSDRLSAAYGALWPCALFGVLCLGFAASVIGRTAGLLWLLAPLLARALGRDVPAAAAPSRTEAAWLRDRAAEIWRYFTQFCTAEDNYLPPDNFQQSPPVGLAHRTSPTNIGLGLLCALAADDLGLAPREKCLQMIDSMLSTAEALPKWHGHLYNWYDTQTLRALHPAYVSTVDSGNLAACLVALCEGLREKTGAEELAARARKLYLDMDFRPLYDKKRDLFHIGWDAERGALSEGWYDLLASEARLTAYLAIAKGDAPRRHWRRLSRAQLQKDGYRGMASWTGTVFEYLMPDLLLPLPADSLLDESARFCLYCQRKRTFGLRLPWGASESAFASLDPLLNYRYKAHGVQALALRRGMDAELVAAPYASFLALHLAPAAALRNLRRLEAMGARGPWGFWDAVDFTPARLAAGEGRRVVRCVMAHHLGMSLLAIDNRLQDGVMRRRFMASPEMAAFRCLLEEKVPTGGTVLHLRGGAQSRPREIKKEDISGQKKSQVWAESGEGEPRCCLLSNGFYSIMLTDSGRSEACCRDLLPYAGRIESFDGKPGMAFALRDETGEHSLLPPDRYCFSQDTAAFRTRCSGCAVELETAVAGSEPGELRRVTAEYAGEGEYCCKLLLRLEVVLAGEEDYVNHPAYFGLGLYAQAREKALTVRRLARGRLEACALALCCSDALRVRAIEDRGAYKEPGKGRWLVGGRLELETELDFSPAARSRSVSFSLCVAKTEEGALSAARRALEQDMTDRAALPAALCGMLGLTRGLPGVLALLRRSRFGTPDAEASAGKREELWALGLSGDLPIVYARLRARDELLSAAELLRQHALLQICGARFDLVLLNPDGGDYRGNVLRSLWTVLQSMEREKSVGARGGVHFLEDTPENLRRMAGAAIAAFGAEEAPEDCIMSTNTGEPCGAPSCGFDEDGAFCFDASDALPPRAWSQMLTNGRIGCLAADCGTGALWYRNAHEAQLLAWRGDAYLNRGEEDLEMIMSTGAHSLFASPGDGESRVTYDLGTAVWERAFCGARVRVTAFVPLNENCRVLLIEYEGPDDARLLWKLRPLLASGEADRCALRCGGADGMLWAENPRFPYPETRLRMLASEAPLATEGGRRRAGRCAQLRLLLPAAKTSVLVCGTDAPERLRQVAAPEEALRLLQETRAFWRRHCRAVAVRTPDERLDRFLNGWAVYQTLAGRLLGRCSLYQCGGAYGFRDQLQDAVNLLPVLPEAARKQILAACAHQYEAGDVQHWWHAMPEGPRGVRTRCSDDLLWLPWAICEYTDATGDDALCAEETAFLVSPPLRADEESRYERPARGAETASVLEHGFRALATVMRRGTGRHGLLRMLSGDWNDGFDRVGAAGEGESVWLSWFFAHTAARYADLMQRLGAEETRVRPLREAGKAAGRASDAAWDGDWYLRGWFDDGTPIGSAQSEACRIDSVAQSFSALCAEADPARREKALQSAFEHLYDRENGLVRLFTPPFKPQTPDPGYITSYGPGFRENGGQYTHGAVWLAMALLRTGRIDEGWAVLRALLPDGRDALRYGAEPYVAAADVYGAPGHEGQAGWSWYTGSAGWLLRVALGELLGLRMEKGRLVVSPRLPSDWDGYTLALRGENGALRRFTVGREGILREEAE